MYFHRTGHSPHSKDPLLTRTVPLPRPLCRQPAPPPSNHGWSAPPPRIPRAASAPSFLLTEAEQSCAPAVGVHILFFCLALLLSFTVLHTYLEEEMEPAFPSDRKMAADFLMHEKIWFDKFKYDDAEKRYYEQMNGPVASPSCQQENGASTILRDIARARENIQKSLAGSASTTSSAGPAGDQNELVTRIANLEVENQNLHSVIADLQLAISKLETRLNTLEKCSTSHHPSATPPTQHVTPMKKVESPAAPSKKVELPSAPPAKKVGPSEADDEDEDDDIDLFGSGDEEEDQEAAKVREERLRQYAEKKSKKPGLIAKSSILLDVKPWDDETDMAKMEDCVRSIQMDGLVWGASKLVPVGYGIKKLQIQCVVEDDKVGTDILEEEITKFEDYVQSVDIAAFNKI
uniref:Elongation factor 1-delta n=1 Tax=Gopherus agassizii TaxID=38772 RepID=A0A452IBT6_9SAUR